jgi:hypothetical protein
MITSVILFLLLTALAVAHVHWARGGLWPGRDEASLVAFVVGREDFGGMPPRSLIVAVAIALFVGGCTALALGFDVEGIAGRVIAYAGAGFTAVFGLRGVAGFLPFWRKRHPLEPFATLDRYLYSPACVLIGEAFFTLVSPRF